MKRIFLLLALVAFLFTGVSANAIVIELYADSAPNAYGSPDWLPWKTDTFAAVAGGTFTNMSNGTYAGTNTWAPTDGIVYSTGDLGQRLQWIYWLPGETVAGLDGRFQVKDVADWDGVAYAGGAVVDGPEVGWSQPLSWMNYDPDGIAGSGDEGVIGTFGNAWWAWDNVALPYSTDANPYNETNIADITGLAGQMSVYQTYWTGMFRYRDEPGGAWTQTGELALYLTPVPEPSTLLLIGGGLAGLFYIRRKKA
ncbi:MAG: PEP-CTERM sorting domain-containing protein [Candidatus Schekmanbacteria bacterium]|nr:PEP-CTERM sorting domain-containing protein [Candidatus Schekmanbacteria bacterium]